MLPLTNPPRVKARDTLLMIVDLQDKLLAAIPDRDEILGNAAFLLDVAHQLHVATMATEQAPEKLGDTTASIAQRLRHDRISKSCFSCCEAAGVFEKLHQAGRPNIVLVGVETHVCIAQTALDLLGQGFRPWLAIDAIGSRHEMDHHVAIDRLEKAGAIVTTSEALAFEWLGDAAHPHFKEVSTLIKQRNQGTA